jgi:hypothetical protein
MQIQTITPVNPRTDRNTHEATPREARIMAAPSGLKATVSERALFSRVDHKLRHDGEKLCRCRFDSRWWSDLGDIYAIDVTRNAVVATNIDLEAWARELDVLREWEELEASPELNDIQEENR